MDEIRIDNLKVFANHGVYPEENQKGQNFYVSLVMYTDLRPAGLKDDLNLSTNYGEVCHFINDFMKQNTFKLIETVAEKLAEELLLSFAGIKRLKLEIKKPEAPIGLPFENVSVKIERGYEDVYLSVGSNMGDSKKLIYEACDKLKNIREINFINMSKLIVTKPYGGVKQDDFLNGVIHIETFLRPTELLERLHEIEALLGRKRIIHWGPRTIDLDIIFYGKMVFENKDLIIPHVDLQNRRFVLEPMCEIAPNFRHPVLNKTVRELLDMLKEDN